jgi:hypothetical protein
VKDYATKGRRFEDLNTRIRDVFTATKGGRLPRTWEELDLRLDVPPVTQGAHIELLRDFIYPSIKITWTFLFAIYNF